MKSLAKPFDQVFDFCRNYPNTGHGISVNTPEVKICINALSIIGSLVLAKIGQSNWSYKIAKGAGAYPRIPWIVFGPKTTVEKAPGAGLYVCIAFDEDGKGFVGGVNVATTEKKIWADQLNPASNSWGLSIDGKKPNTKYSNGFFNPKPFYVNKLDESELITHLSKSADKLNILLDSEKMNKHNFTHIHLESCDLTTGSINIFQAALAKPFTILTGASGTGKTRLAESLCKRFSKPSISGDPFSPGSEIQSGRIRYLVNKSSPIAVEFWNNVNESEATKVTLPREIIQEWVDCIIEQGFDEATGCRDIRDIVSPISKFSNQLHSFETHLKAAAFALINSLDVSDSYNNSSIVAVGSDWTDNRPVLGFVNHLRNYEEEGEFKGRPIFQTTEIVDLLLCADATPDIPHFLVLDEMNLSHVERYFADFLSAMEQSDGRLTFHSEGAVEDYRLPRSAVDNEGVPRSIPYPQNLFIIGTVNIDETTYMFSPKVLDRANVIEFTVDPDEFKTFLKTPGNYPEIEPASPGEAKSFLQLALAAREDNIDPLPGNPKDDDSLSQKIATHLHDLFLIMQAGRFEFAYRTGKEVNRYLRICRYLAEDKDDWDSASSTGWKSDLDDQILQKVLPKLHGSVGRIGSLLSALAIYCHKGTDVGTLKELKAKFPEALALTEDGATFPKSFRKLKSMLQSLKEEQFVSFIQ